MTLKLTKWFLYKSTRFGVIIFNKNSIATVLFLIINSFLFSQEIRYVSQASGTPTGDGLTWATASNDLQATINDIPSGGIIRLEIGTYTPKAYPPSCVGCTYTRDYAFYANKPITIVGGYAGAGMAPAFHAQNTILSGDIGIEGDVTDNCHHVLISNHSVSLEQLSIKGGNANVGGLITIDGKEFTRGSGGGIYSRGASIDLKFVMISDNFATHEGGGLYAGNSSLYMRKGSVLRNNANRGGGLYLSNTEYQNGLIEKSVIANNNASEGGAMFFAAPWLHVPYVDGSSYRFNINYSTFYGNSAPNGSVLFATSPSLYALGLNNSIVYGNAINTYNYGASSLYATNSIVQGGSPSGGFVSFRNELPDFINPSDIDGADNLLFTDDDGLVPQVTGKAALANVGAYLWNTTLCPSSTVLHVDINNPTPGNGSSWSTSFNDLNLALNFARRCNMVQEVKVAQGTYLPNRYNWYRRAEDYGFSNGRYFYILDPISSGELTPDLQSATFIIRPGLKVYGGYPTGGGTRNTASNTTILSGYNSSGFSFTRNVVSIHEPNTNSSDSTVLDGFTIKGGAARMGSEARVGDYFSFGAGLTINSNYVRIKNNIFTENAAIKGSAIQVLGNHIELVNNLLTGNTVSASGYFLYEVTGSLIKIDGDSCTISNNDMSVNALGTASTVLDVRGSAHLIKDNSITDNPSEGIYLNGDNSNLKNNLIKNNFRNGISLLGDQNEVQGNIITNNFGHGIYAQNARDTRFFRPIYLFSNTALIKENIINDNAENGIFVEEGNTATILSNTISGNIKNGIEGTLIAKNNLIEKSKIGIKSDTCTAISNIIQKNTDFGISTDIGTIASNAVVDNLGSGLKISHGTIFNNVFANNEGTTAGGIIINNTLIADSLSLSNNTFYKNKANSAIGAGGLFIMESKINKIVFTNNVFWDNYLNSLTNLPGSDYAYVKNKIANLPVFKNNMMQIGASLYTSANNNELGIGSITNIFATNPSFVNSADVDGPDNILMTKDDGLVLGDLSIGLEAGLDPAIIPLTPVDIVGLPRVLGAHSDIGAYEKINCIALETMYVNKNHVHTSGGSGWRSPVLDLSIALYLAHQCPNASVINVSADEYTPSNKPFEMQLSTKGVELITSDIRDNTFHIRSGVNMYGGFIVRGDTAMRDPAVNKTTLRGKVNDSLVFHTVMMSYHKDYWTAPLDTTVLDGFTIVEGHAKGSIVPKLTVNNNDFLKTDGGGVTIFGGTNKFSNCIIENNVASKTGGAMYLNTDTTIIENTVIIENSASSSAGIAAFNGKHQLVNSSIIGNRADTTGGVAFYNGVNQVVNTVFFNNKSLQKSGGLTLSQGNDRLVNSTFFDNKSNQAGALYLDGGIHTIANTIFHRNKLNDVDSITGADYLHSSAALTLATKNNSFQLRNVSLYTSGSLNGLGTAVANIFHTNPLFYDTLDVAGIDNRYGTYDDGLRLLVGSPMVNVGDNTSLPVGITKDIYGSPRIQKGIVELGAYEGPNVRCPEGIFDTVFVDRSVAISGNGGSWAEAFKTLDEALFITHMCPFIKYVCVAEGNYYPSAKPYNMQHYRQGIEIETADPRDVSFHLRDGVVLLGGYKAGGGARDISSFVTKLNGDIHQNGINKAYHTSVMASSPFWLFRSDTTVIEGVNIENGYADNKPYSIEVNNASIRANNGGGLYMTNGYGTMRLSKIEQNFSDGYGGGVYSNLTKFTSLTHNVLAQNTSSIGGGVYVNKANIFELGYNTISQNTANDQGGGVATDSSENFMHHNSVKSNSSKFGSGYYITGNFKVEDSDFIANSTVSTGKGSAIFVTKSSGIIDRCAFDDNTSDLQGAGIYSTLNPSISVRNSIFHSNKATNAIGQGGAIYNDKNTYFDAVNCTTFGNVANQGSSIYISSSNTILKNNVFFDLNPIFTSTGAPSISHSIVKGGHPLCISCPGVLGDIDPQFNNTVDVVGSDGLYRTVDDGLNVNLGSPAIDNGTDFGPLWLDITYGLRNWGQRDIGAYEYFKCPTYDTLYVDQQVVHGKGATWVDAIPEVATALYIAHACPNIDQIHVAQGDYLPRYKPFNMKDDQSGTEIFTTSNFDVTFHLRSGLEVIGGYKNGGTNRNPDLFPSVLSGDIDTGALDARHVVLIASNEKKWTENPKVILDGFKIIKGLAGTNSELIVNEVAIKRNFGAGVYSDNTSAIILHNNEIKNNLGQGMYLSGGQNLLSNNRITDNVGTNGGGVYLTKGINTVTNNIISKNIASYGGGLYLDQDSTLLSGNTISSNSNTFFWGGGIYGQKSKIVLFNNSLDSNRSNFGGGAYLEECIVKIDSNRISNNRATQFGGAGIQLENSSGRLYKNTFTSNVADQNGGGGLVVFNSPVDVESNLFLKNKALSIGGGLLVSSARTLIANNVFYLDSASSGAALQTYSGFHEIINNTFYDNNSTIGGALATIGGANDLTNNIFTSNRKAGLNTIGADYYNEALNKSFNVFNNNSLQFAENSYGSSNNNELAVSTSNVFETLPQFTHLTNVLGPDMVFGTMDDGFRLSTTSPLINVGNKTLVPDSILLDAKHEPRVMNYQVDLGAYETFRDPCISNVMHVDTNRAAGGNGNNWATAFNTLSEALYVAHTCPNVDSILIAEGTYYPESKPYQMNASLKGDEISTTNERDLTFHLRQGLAVIGGYPGGGDESPSSYYKVNLVGLKPFDIYPSYHTVLMDTSSLWSSANKKTSISYCIIKNGTSEVDGLHDSINVNNNWIYNTNGSGIYINGSDAILKQNTITENVSNSKGGGIYIAPNSKVYLDANTITANAARYGGGIAAKQARLTFINNMFNLNLNTIQELRGCFLNLCTTILLDGNDIDGIKLEGGSIKISGVNTVKKD